MNWHPFQKDVELIKVIVIVVEEIHIVIDTFLGHLGCTYIILMKLDLGQMAYLVREIYILVLIQIKKILNMKHGIMIMTQDVVAETTVLDVIFQDGTIVEE